MKIKPRFPFWMIVVTGIVLASLMGLGWVRFTGSILGAPFLPVQAESAAITHGQTAAILGANFLLADPPPGLIYLPGVQKGSE